MNGRERGEAAVPVCLSRCHWPLLQALPEAGVLQPSRRDREEDAGWVREKWRERSGPREGEG
jgi:hypothetical protein